MRRPSFVLRLARREFRSGVRRVGLYMVSITLGVGALVSIHSFRRDVARSVQDGAEVLMGANVRLSSSRPLPDSVTTVLDSLSAEGVASSHVVTAVSMVLAPRTGTVRLLQVKSVTGGFPFYGTVRTRPEGLWGRHLEPGQALVDPAVLIQLGIEVGDSLLLGGRHLTVLGSAVDLPTDVGFQSAVGPRVYLAGGALEEAGLLGLGSLATYETFLEIPVREDREALLERYEELFLGTRVAISTAEERAGDLTRAVDYLGRYLGLIGLAALLLGGIGVASAIHVFVKEKLTGVAVLRCLGARQWSVFQAYLLLAAAMGLMGALAGVVLGVGVQQLLPLVLASVLPVDVRPSIALLPMAAGLGMGLWVSFLFALIPLLEVRDVPPLLALRRDFEGEARRSHAMDVPRVAAYALLVGSVLGLSVLEAPEPVQGLVFAGALGVTGLLLWLTAWLAIHTIRRFFPKRARYTFRQGVANLFRPQNQTVAVTLSLGFGTLVVGTVLLVQASLVQELSFEVGTGQPNLLLFDIQPAQVDGVVAMLPEEAREGATVDPVVPSRVLAVKGRRAVDLASDTSQDAPAPWALRRQYRHTYRDRLTGAEELVAGRWWEDLEDAGGGSALRGSADNPARVSLEADVAESLGVLVGDRITWDVGGIEVESVVTSLRFVDWERLETNFFVVFEPGVLEEAPQMSVVLARIEGEAERAVFQRDLVLAFPNVSALDVTRVQEAVEAILGRVDRAIRFLAGFSAVAGLLVLAGSLATSRYQRLREGALLRTLGARRGQVLAVLLAEYVVLGALAAFTGLLLAVAAAGFMVRQVFEIPFVPSPGALCWIWLGVTGLTVGVGLLGSRGALGRPPLPVLRELAE